MSTQIRSLEPKTWQRHAKRTTASIALVLTMCGCQPATNTPTWQTYTNDRYNFEFLYPSNWKALPPPDNNDGQAFVAPQNSQVQIRGWAGNNLPQWHLQQQGAKTTTNSNFKTTQGVSGQLTVEVGKDLSSMTLKITKGQIHYYWQGQAPSAEFDRYYRYFSYIAQEYKIRDRQGDAVMR